MSLIAAPFAILAILYAGGFLAQLLGNYATWKQGGGIPGDGTSPLAASPDFLLCLSSVLRPPYGVYGILICIGLLAVLLIMVMRMGYGDADEYDEDRNFSYSAKGTYGTSGWMSRKEMSGVLDLVPDLRKHKGTVPARSSPASWAALNSWTTARQWQLWITRGSVSLSLSRK